MLRYDNLVGKNVPVNPPSGQSVTLAELAEFMRLDEGDMPAAPSLTGLIAMAEQYVLARTGQILMPQTYACYLDGFPSSGRPLRLTLCPVRAISSVQYYDAEENLQTLSSTVYQLDNKGVAALVGLKSGQSWPSVYNRFNPVVVNVEVGYSSRSAIPEGLKHAVKLIASHFYDNRAGNAPLPESVIKYILEPFRMLKIF